MKETYVERLY